MLVISTFYLHKRSYKSRFLPFLLLIFPSFVLDFGRTICLMPFGLLSSLWRYFLCPIEGFTTTAAAERERPPRRPFQLFHHQILKLCREVG